MACLDDRTIEDLVRGALPSASRAITDAHLASCGDCRSVVAEYMKWAIPDADDATAASSSAADAGVRRAPLPALAPGTAFGRHRILRPLGSGGGGAVYEAYDPQLGRRVAIKVLHDGRADDVLLREARAMARLNHPGIVSVYDVGVVDGQVFLVMELVEGETLAVWLRRARRRWPQVLRVLIDAARGLAAAHRGGVVHGDVKPDNLLISADGRVRVSDFGLAPVACVEIEMDSAPAGTPGYVAPEVIAGGIVDARSDEWAFALTAYRALQGDPPPELARTPAQPLGQPARGRLPAGIVRALRKALAPDPAQRFTDVDALVRALEAAVLRRWLGIATTVALLGAAALAAVSLGGPRAVAARCGNHVVDRGEDCDDGNNVAHDGCDRCLRCPADALAGVGHGCYTLHVEPLNWDAAQAACLGRGESLATFPDLGSYHAVARGLRATAGTPVWIGVRQDDAAGLAWRTGAPVDSSLRHLLPVTAAEQGGNCTFIDRADYRTRWLAAACEEPRAYVCERRAWAVRPATGHAYRVVPISDSWDEASATCRALGGALATVTDGDEQAFVAGLVSGYTWMGGHDRKVEGDFRWITGESFGFRAFAPGQPNDSAAQPEQDCLAMGSSGGWHDAPCRETYMAVCEIE